VLMTGENDTGKKLITCRTRGQADAHSWQPTAVPFLRGFSVPSNHKYNVYAEDPAGQRHRKGRLMKQDLQPQ